MLAAAAAFDEAGSRIAEMRRLVDAAAVPRAKLWDRVRTLREDLEQAIADRMGRDASDLAVRVTAGLVLDLFHLLDRGTHDERTRREVWSGCCASCRRARSCCPASRTRRGELPDDLIPAAEDDAAADVVPTDVQCIMSAKRL